MLPHSLAILPDCLILSHEVVRKTVWGCLAAFCKLATSKVDSGVYL